MAISRPHFPTIVAFVAGCLATLVAVSVYTTFQRFWSLSKPVIYADVDDQLLKNTGFSFPRPASATNACMAITGHGMGDVCTYLSFDISNDRLIDFLETLPSCREIPSSELGASPYRDRLPPKVIELIMPDVLPDEVKVYSIGHAVGMYDIEQERLHLRTF
jgi:hypothetical protein